MPCGSAWFPFRDQYRNATREPDIERSKDGSSVAPATRKPLQDRAAPARLEREPSANPAPPPHIAAALKNRECGRTCRNFVIDDDASAERREEQPAGGASPEALFVTLYAELRRLADRELNRRPDLPVSAMTLVHEAYLKFSGRPELTFASRGQFLAYAAQAMRGLIVDAARERRALKRGGSFHITRLSTEVAGSIPEEGELERLSDAIDRLRELEPRLAEVVELKYFCGFSFAEIAAARGTAERTVQRDWEKARLLLYGDLRAP